MAREADTAGPQRHAMKAAVLGHPVTHSLSPALHRAAYAALGLRGWSYGAIDCDEAQLPTVLAGLGSRWAGLSLTMPLKRAVLPLLDVIDPLAADVGAVNTVLLRDGRRRGYNTDVGGMVDALAAAGIRGGTVFAAPDRTRLGDTPRRGIDTGGGQAPGGDVLIIGAGATACSALAALRQIGVVRADVAVRNRGRTGELAAAARRLGVAIQLRDIGCPGSAAGRPAVTAALTEPAPRAGLVICTVPPLAADGLLPWLLGGPRPPIAVLDVAYDPWPTRLAVAAKAAGSLVAGGFDLLVHQAGRQVELMTGRPAPLAAMRQAGLAELTACAGGAGRVARTGVSHHGPLR